MTELHYNLETHLTFIQNTITRMANNSASAKNWHITMLVALITLSFTNNAIHCLVFMFSIGLTLIFWGLDAYYLYLERGFRELYKLVIARKVSNYQMVIPKNARGFIVYIKCLLHSSTTLYYVSIVVLIVLLTVFSNFWR